MQTAVNHKSTDQPGSQSPGMIFVVGVGRSGTTLMQVFLSAHPAISFLPEINLLRRFMLNGELNRIRDEKGVEAVIEILNTDAKTSRLPHSWEELVESTFDSVDFCKDLFHRLTEIQTNEETKYVGYKDALLIQNPETLLTEWPNSRIVHIYRDPRDVLASRKKAGWSKNYSNRRNVVAGLIQLEIMERCKKSEFSSRIIDVKYEDLLTEPDQVARRLCEFLELEYSPQMLAFNQNADGLVFEDEMQWKKNLFSPLMKGNSGKWKDELSTEEIALVEKSYRSEMDRLQYASSDAYGKLSATKKLALIPQLVWLKVVKFTYLAKRQMFEARS